MGIHGTGSPWQAANDLTVSERSLKWPLSLVVRLLEETAVSPKNDKPVHDPQELERQLIARANVGDVDGMVALFEPSAVLAIGDGRFARGRNEIHEFYTNLLASGFVFHAGEPYPAVLNGELALTSSRYPNGTISSEVARQQADGTWLWVIDYPTIGE